MAWDNNKGGNGGFQQAPIKPTAYDDNNWKLWGDEKVDGGQSVPSMKISVAKNQPRLTVYTGRKDGQGRAESIWARMNPYAFFELLAVLEQVAKGKPDVRYAMKNEKMIDDRNNPGKKKMITESTTWVGKNSDGSVYIAVTAYNKPNIPFVFKPPRFHSLVQENGQPMDIAMVSPLCALEFVRVHRGMLPAILALAYDAESKSVGNNYQKGGNGNNGAGNRDTGSYSNNGNNNSQNSSSAANDSRWNNSGGQAPMGDDDDDAAPAFQGLGF